jgi:hypothetical protein
MLALLGFIAEFAVRDDYVGNVPLFELLAYLGIPLPVALLKNDQVRLVERLRHGIDFERIVIWNLTLDPVYRLAFAVIESNFISYALL